MKRNIFRLRDAFDWPNEITSHFYNDLVVDFIEALCIVLRRLADPCHFLDIVPLCGRSVLQLSMIFNETIDLIDSIHNHRLSDLNQGWLGSCCLKAFAELVHKKGAALDNVLGFIDGTAQPCWKQTNVIQWAHKP